jgi:hypothetical protein
MRVWLIKSVAAGVMTGLIALASVHPLAPLVETVAEYGDHLHDVLASVHSATGR